MEKITTILSFQQRVGALEQFGYTHREAEFLVLAALNSGYFLRRQFSPRGKLDDAFCRRLVANGHGKVAHASNQTQVYHITGKPLYRALGQVDNRHRRKHESFYMRSKIMLLDYVLASRQGPDFLPTEQDKVAYFCKVRGLDTGVLPSKTYVGRDGSRTTRFFVDKFPVRVDQNSGAVSFGFVDDGMTKAGFRTWLTQIGALVDALGAAEIVFISASVESLSWAKREFARRFGDGSGLVEGYFRIRQELELRGLAGHTQEALDRYRNWQRQYADPKYERQYSAWKRSGALVDSQADGVTLATHLLPFRYGMFGEVGAGKASNVGLRDGSDEIEGGCVCFVATGDQNFVKISFSPRVIRRISDVRRLDPGAVQQTAEPVRILGCIPATVATERWLHREFSAEHEGKKWFRVSEKLSAFLRAAGLSDRRRAATNGGDASGFSGVSGQ